MILTDHDSIAALIDSLERLELERASLFARYGPGGTFDHERKVLLATLAAAARLEAESGNRKITEAAIDEAARNTKAYQDFIAKAYDERTRLAELDAKCRALEARISLGKAVVYREGKLAGLAS